MLKIHQISSVDPVSGLPLEAGSVPMSDGTTTYVSSSASTGAMVIPNGTTAQRPTPVSARVVRFNSTLNSLEVWDGSAWSSLPSNSVVEWTLGGTFENGQVVIRDGQIYTANDFISSGTAFSLGTTGATYSPVVNSGDTWMGTHSLGTTYGVGDVVSDGSGNLYYSKTAANLGNPLTDFTAWELYSPYVDLSVVMAVMVGADGTLAGKKGMVPPPAATDNLKFLRGDGTWAAASGGSSLTEVTQSFTATASQWQFTLSNVPNATELQNLELCVNGMCCRYASGHYMSLAGSVLSLTANVGYNLIAGDRVTVTYKY